VQSTHFINNVELITSLISRQLGLVGLSAADYEGGGSRGLGFGCGSLRDCRLAEHQILWHFTFWALGTGWEQNSFRQ
jgi:hypothetical protein